MREKIKLLIELQEIDSTIIRDKSIIDSIPFKLLVSEKSFNDVQSRYEKIKQKHELLEKKKKEKERETEEINEKIKKIKARVSEIKTNKEYQAHLKEIEAAEKERYSVEDEILSIMEEIDMAGKEMKGEDARVKAEKDKLDAFRKEVEREISAAEKELEEKRAKRADTAKMIDQDIYKDYMTVLKANSGLAVVEVRDEICQGCNMNVPPQMFVEIKNNEEIIQCPQCRRILYWKEKNEVL